MQDPARKARFAYCGMIVARSLHICKAFILVEIGPACIGRGHMTTPGNAWKCLEHQMAVRARCLAFTPWSEIGNECTWYKCFVIPARPTAPPLTRRHILLGTCVGHAAALPPLHPAALRSGGQITEITFLTMYVHPSGSAAILSRPENEKLERVFPIVQGLVSRVRPSSTRKP
jgi:hypothetical protein